MLQRQRRQLGTSFFFPAHLQNKKLLEMFQEIDQLSWIDSGRGRQDYPSYAQSLLWIPEVAVSVGRTRVFIHFESCTTVKKSSSLLPLAQSVDSSIFSSKFLQLHSNHVLSLKRTPPLCLCCSQLQSMTQECQLSSLM